MIHVGVLLGGRSTEHNISLRSGTFIYNNLDKRYFLVKPILISHSGVAYYPVEWNVDWKIDPLWATQMAGGEYSRFILDRFQSQLQPISRYLWEDPSFGGCEAIVMGLHGGEGEDGRIQSLFELAGIPYTGSGVLASSLAMDKFRSNLLFRQAGLNVANFMDLKKHTFLKHSKSSTPSETWRNILIELDEDLQFPVFSKPTTGGSSVGTFRSDSDIDWIKKISEVMQTEDRMLIQELIRGREVSCGVLEIPGSSGYREWKVLPPTEIIPQTEFFDYEAKYTPGGSLEVTPPNMPEAWIRSIQDSSLTAHKALGCEGYSRTDFIVSEDGIPWVLETNTLPGMTGTSLIPQQAEKVGIEMKQVFTWLLQIALERKGIPIPWE